MVLPDNADPDEFIKAHGVEEYNRRRGEASPHIQFVIDQAVRDRNLHNPPEKGEAVREVLPFVRVVRDRVQKREYFDMVMDDLRIEDAALRRSLWRDVNAKTPVSDEDVQQKVAHVEVVPPTVAERQLLELLIHDGELRGIVLPHMEDADYDGLPTATLFRALVESDRAGAEMNFDSLHELVGDDPAAAALLPELWMGERERAEGEATDDALAEAEKCVVALRLMKVDRRLRELGAEIAAAERAGDAERRDRLVMENLEWTRLRSALNARVAVSSAS